jgi:hypothetical protein
LTVGFVGRLAFYQAMVNGPAWRLALALIAETLLISAMLRRLVMPEPELVMPQGVPAHVGYALALAVAAAPLFVPGATRVLEIQPLTTLSTATWIAWVIPLAAAVVLAVASMRFRHRAGRWGLMADKAIRLDWLYSMLLPALRAPARAGLFLADLLEGEGAFLWMLVILALVLLYMRR